MKPIIYIATKRTPVENEDINNLEECRKMNK